MNKFSGKIGFIKEEETDQDVWSPVIEWRECFGDILRVSKSYQTSDKVNDDIKITNSISILADSYAYTNIPRIRCIEWLGNIWKVTDITLQYPRLILSLGGLYNVTEGTGEETPGDSGD